MDQGQRIRKKPTSKTTAHLFIKKKPKIAEMKRSRENLFHECRFGIDSTSGIISKETVQCNLIVTSPPYFGCRDYTIGSKNALGNSFSSSSSSSSVLIQLGHEKTPYEYVRRLCKTFENPQQTLAIDGSLFVIIGDTFARSDFVDEIGEFQNIYARETIGIHHLVVIEMRRLGYRMWQEIVWQKPSVPPSGAAQQRCNPCHEYVLWFVRRDCMPRPKFNARSIREPGKTPAGKVMPPVGGRKYGEYKKTIVSDGMRCRQDVWNICPSRDKSAHVAPFPEEIVEICVLACTDEFDVVLDPFAGTLTTQRVCQKLGRSSICYDMFDHQTL